MKALDEKLLKVKAQDEKLSLKSCLFPIVVIQFIKSQFESPYAHINGLSLGLLIWIA